MNSLTDFEKIAEIFVQARLLAQEQRYTPAENLLRQLIDIDPAFFPTYSLLELVLDLQERTDEAVLIRNHGQWVQLAVRLLEDA